MKRYEHIDNKEPKDSGLYKLLRASITKDNRRNHLTDEDFANEIGISGGTLQNKLKPSQDMDLKLMEFIHILKITGDLNPLVYINNIFDLTAIPKVNGESTIKDINILVDNAQMNQNDVFYVAKKALEDGIIDAKERKDMILEIEKQQGATAKLLQQLKDLKV